MCAQFLAAVEKVLAAIDKRETYLEKRAKVVSSLAQLTQRHRPVGRQETVSAGRFLNAVDAFYPPPQKRY